MLPREFPPRSTVQRYCYAWREDGTWRRINYQLLMQARLAAALPPEAWQVVTWREGTAEPLASRLAALRARPAQGDSRRSLPRPEEWLLVEWPEDEPQPAEFWLSNLPADTPTERPVHLAKRRWLIERNYLELKQELGLGHFEGRGFQHYAALRVAGYGFLSAERAAIPPSGPGSAWRVKTPVLPDGDRPHGTAAPARATHPAFDCDPAGISPTPSYRSCSDVRVVHRESRTGKITRVFCDAIKFGLVAVRSTLISCINVNGASTLTKSGNLGRRMSGESAG